jgi:hypothetical protein
MSYVIRLVYALLALFAAVPAAIGSPMPPEGGLAAIDVLVRQCSDLQPALAEKYAEAADKLLPPAREKLEELRKSALYRESVKWWQKTLRETEKGWIEKECAAILKPDGDGNGMKRRPREECPPSVVPNTSAEPTECGKPQSVGSPQT